MSEFGKLDKCADIISNAGHGVRVEITGRPHIRDAANFCGDPGTVFGFLDLDTTRGSLYEDPARAPETVQAIRTLQKQTDILINGQPIPSWCKRTSHGHGLY